MIRLTRINQAPFFLNANLIEFVESTPDTVVTTVNGQKMMVLEDAEEVVRRVEAYHRRVLPLTVETSHAQFGER